jgi:non-ribosomal peptide synthase protein (TIGR01720 family)
MAVNYESSLKGRLRGAGSTIHPLLNECVSETPEKIIYSTTFSQDRHWVLSEHRVGGKATLPGVAYLEIVRAAVEKYAEGKDVELREVFFITPLAVEDGRAVEAFTVLKRSGDDFEFSVVSKMSQDGASWQEHARGYVRLLERTTPHETDLQSIAGALTKEEMLFPDGAGMTTAEIDDEGVPAFVYCGPRWNSLTKVNIGEREAFASLKLPDAFASDLGRFTLHPAMLDMAVGFARRYAGAGAYLPFSYERVTVRGRITAQVYSYLRFREELDPTKETITFDISLFDDRGREVVEIENFTVKRVSGERPSGLPVAAGTDSRPAEAYATLEADLATGSADGAGALSEHVRSGIRTEEGLDAFRRIMARPELSQIAVSVDDLNELLKQKEIFTDARLLELEELNKVQGVGATHERPELSTAYVAPRNELESTLTSIWQEYLGIAKVGIHDNFFELGGDSILSIRVIARAKQRGLSLSPDRLFRHPTVAELAASLHSASSDSSMPSRTPRAPLSGPAPMLPAQLRFFEQTPVEPHHFNQAVLLAPTRHIDTRPLASAARALLSHHDALRARFSVEEGVWRQLIAPPSQAADFRIELVDLTGIGDVGEARAAMEAECGRLQSSFELGRGPLFAAALFELGGGRGQRLLLAAHHLVVDGVSWRVLLDDLERGYLQAEGGEAVELGEATASVAERARELEEWVRGESGREEAAYWAEVEGVKAEVVKGERVKAEGVRAEVVSGSVPVRDSLVDNVEGRVVRARRRLGAEVTRRVLAGSGAGRGAGAAEVLAAALGVALCGWSGAGEMLVDVEGHGRESASGLDLSRTVGWMTSVYPLRLRGGGAGEALRWAKEAMRGVPRGGVGYGALRYLGYLGREWSGASEGGRGVSFNYLGQFGEVGGGLWRWAEEGTGEWRSGRVERRYELEVEARVVEGEMEIGCGYVGGRQCEEEMEEMVRRMGELVEEMAGVGEGGATPSDFPDADLSQAELNDLLVEFS